MTETGNDVSEESSGARSKLNSVIYPFVSKDTFVGSSDTLVFDDGGRVVLDGDGTNKFWKVFKVGIVLDVCIKIVTRVMWCSGRCKLLWQRLLKDGQPLWIDIREGNSVGISLFIARSVVFPLGDKQLDSGLIIFVNTANCSEELIKNNMELWTDGSRLEISQQTDGGGVIPTETQKLSATRLRCPFWNFVSALECGTQYVSWTSPDTHARCKCWHAT